MEIKMQCFVSITSDKKLKSQFQNLNISRYFEKVYLRQDTRNNNNKNLIKIIIIKIISYKKNINLHIYNLFLS